MKVIAILLFMFPVVLFSQSTCGNLDFENGNLDGWNAFTGFWNTIDTLAIPGVVPGRHTIMTGNGLDANTNNKISVVAPGGLYSCRLGNDEVHGCADRLTYTLNVGTENSLFVYKYAVVLEDPGHMDEEQPQFEVVLYDSDGMLIDPVCGYYQVTASENIPGFESYNNVRFKDWTTVGLDLSPYFGQEITISFTTRDCGQGGHFGYAYIDAFSSEMKLFNVACAGNEYVELSAPIGFEYVWNPGGLTDQHVSIPVNSGVNEITCTMTSVTGCIVKLATDIQVTEIFPGFEADACDFINIKDTSLVANSTLASWDWTFANESTLLGSEEKDPQFFVRQSGVYTVNVTLTTANGCSNTYSKTVNVPTRPAVLFKNSFACQADAVQFTDLSNVGLNNNLSWSWDFGDGNFSSERNPSHTFSGAGPYEVFLSVSSGVGCSSVYTAIVELDPCSIEIPNVFTPNHDEFNESFRIKNLENYESNELVVYNRWGRIAYKAENYDNTWKAENVSSGVYYYVFSYVPLSDMDSRQTLTGYVTVLSDR